MANQLKMAMIHSIITLLGRGWSYRRIARTLGIHRETVSRYVRIWRDEGSKPTISTAGSGMAGESKPAISTPGSEAADRLRCGRPSHCTPYLDIIQQKLDRGLSAQRIYQDLVSETGFCASYSSV